MVIRAAALRVLRYLIKTESDVATFNNLKLPYLVMRYFLYYFSNTQFSFISITPVNVLHVFSIQDNINEINCASLAHWLKAIKPNNFVDVTETNNNNKCKYFGLQHQKEENKKIWQTTKSIHTQTLILNKIVLIFCGISFCIDYCL